MKWITYVSVALLFPTVVWAGSEFLPEANGDAFGLKYAESIAGIPPNAPKIDGDLSDWKHAVWITFDSERELLRGKGSWKGKDDL